MGALEGRVAVITGGISGLGRASAERYAKEGAKVVIADVNAERGENNIVSVTGAVYDTERSILKDVLTRLYDQRKEYKKESFRLQQKAYDLEQELKKS